MTSSLLCRLNAAVICLSNGEIVIFTSFCYNVTMYQNVIKKARLALFVNKAVGLKCILLAS